MISTTPTGWQSSSRADAHWHSRLHTHTPTRLHARTQLEVCHTFLSPLTTLSPWLSANNHRNCLVTEGITVMWIPEERSKFALCTLNTHTPPHTHPPTHISTQGLDTRLWVEICSAGKRFGSARGQAELKQWDLSVARKVRQGQICVRFPLCCGS